MTSGDATPAQMGAFLMGLKVRGETAEELAGGARVLRAKVQRVQRAARAPSTSSAPAATTTAPTTSRPARPSSWPAPACRSPSTATAPSPPSRARPTCWGRWASTSSLPIETLEKALVEAGVCFLMAPRHHSAMRNVAGPRVELAPIRTIFNLLGPMSNPALVKRQLVGVFDRRWLQAGRRGAGPAGARARAGRARAGRHGRDHHHDHELGRLARERQGDARSRSRRRRSACSARVAGRAQGRRCRAQCRGDPRACWRDETNAFRDIVVLNSAAGADGRRQGGRPEAGRRDGRRSRSTAARPRTALETLVRICA